MSDHMTPDRARIVAEEVATSIMAFAGDAKGLHTVSLQLIRPDPSNKRLFIHYGPDEPKAEREDG